MTFYRHFVQRPEFDVAVVTTEKEAVENYRDEIDYPVYLLNLSLIHI